MQGPVRVATLRQAIVEQLAFERAEPGSSRSSRSTMLMILVAESIISARRTSSRDIELTSVGEDVLSNRSVQGRFRDEVDRSTEQL